MSYETKQKRYKQGERSSSPTPSNASLVSRSSRQSSSSTSSQSSTPSFILINKYTVAINSLRNKLKTSESIDELINISGKILELESSILEERKLSYKSIEEEKKKVSLKVKQLEKQLAKACDELDTIENTLQYKVEKYKKSLELSIDKLSKEFSIMSGYLKKIS